MIEFSITKHSVCCIVAYCLFTILSKISYKSSILNGLWLMNIFVALWLFHEIQKKNRFNSHLKSSTFILFNLNFLSLVKKKKCEYIYSSIHFPFFQQTINQSTVSFDTICSNGSIENNMLGLRADCESFELLINWKEAAKIPRYIN